MNYASIRTFDIANGEGIRVSVFVSGCTHHCKGCFNREAWDFSYGSPWTSEVEDFVLKALEGEFIDGLTLLGGEPFEPANQKVLLPFLQKFRDKFANSKTLWIYTGCVLEEELLPQAKNSYWRTDATDEILSMTDVLVDGPFIEDLKDISLKFRGSSNQRILNLKNIL